MAIEEFAPAKINLALHVTGRRDDGYHLLDSLVCFADIGDQVTVRAAEGISLRVTGPMAAGLSEVGDNLVLRAARSFAINRGAEITLDKHLPVSSGIGGGSADAAATLRALSRLWNMPLPGLQAALALGADVPVCLEGRSTRMQGIGDILTPVETMPVFSAVLVNPGIAVSTPGVFSALTAKENDGLDAVPSVSDQHVWVAYLKAQRNDLEGAACAVEPAISDVLKSLANSKSCQLARMSGSGATCFGLFENAEAARAARAAISATHPDWWVKETKLGSSSHA